MISVDQKCIDPLFLSGSDNPSMTIDNIMFNGMNYVVWNRLTRIGLGAKLTLGFIDGTLLKPNESSSEYVRWCRCDDMIKCWILKFNDKRIGSKLIVCEFLL